MLLAQARSLLTVRARDREETLPVTVEFDLLSDEIGSVVLKIDEAVPHAP